MYWNFNTARYIEQCNWCDWKWWGWWWTNPYRTLKPWSYHNPELWLISISYDWVDWITMADKNLWATEVWNVWDDVTEENAWLYYQRWNCYWFNQDLTQYTKSRTRVNARNYWPWNYYSSDIIRVYNDYRDTSNNRNLWWWWEDWSANQRWRDATNYEDRQWPCPDWYHIPSIWKLSQLYDIMLKMYNELNCTSYRTTPLSYWLPFRNALKHVSDMYPEMNDYIKLTPASWTSYNYNWENPFDVYSNNWNIRSSSQTDEISKYIWRNWWKLTVWKSESMISWKNYRTSLFNIRPFKNEPVIPDETWTPLYVLS